MEKKTVIVKISSGIAEKISVEKMEQWNTLANKMSSKYEFVFIPSDARYTMFDVLKED